MHAARVRGLQPYPPLRRQAARRVRVEVDARDRDARRSEVQAISVTAGELVKQVRALRRGSLLVDLVSSGRGKIQRALSELQVQLERSYDLAERIAADA